MANGSQKSEHRISILEAQLSIMAKSHEALSERVSMDSSRLNELSLNLGIVQERLANMKDDMAKSFDALQASIMGIPKGNGTSARTIAGITASILTIIGVIFTLMQFHH